MTPNIDSGLSQRYDRPRALCRPFFCLINLCTRAYRRGAFLIISSILAFMHIKPPTSAPTKVGASALQDLPKFIVSLEEFPTSPSLGLYSFVEHSLSFDFIYRPGQGDRLFVLFSGHANRERLTPPIFQRWSWAPNFPGHCLYIADPMLQYHDDMGLAWYFGSESVDITPTITKIVRTVSNGIGLSERDIIFYGSSGGGFAALKQCPRMPQATYVVINPQTDITKYKSGHVETFLRNCLGGRGRDQASAEFGERLSVFHDAKSLTEANIVYAQNTGDRHHLRSHLQPLAEKLGFPADSSGVHGKFEVLLFESEGGHRRGEPLELVPTLLGKAVQKSKDVGTAI
ncbi:hypothetical protein [Bordetella sp. 15P40C-2]|uniref:hypothetical protein n=1 Tax=Bordetella sp. 15P40C-2 TaxID=2572246 RepID=UPI0013256F71|nr:hypothetical protein [Bordetella sp. 15P40C-2]MVW73288.1 hypothetical protein [Bordetella sp. 15P40C-2]